MTRKLLMLSAFLTAWGLSWSQGFRVSGNRLLDANGNNFVMKGINVPLAWYINDVNNNIAAIKTRTGSNCLRIVVTTNTPDNAWQTCVQRCIDNDIIPMVELHDVTGNNSPSELNRMAQFWASKASYLTRPEIARYILINIANEWSDWNMGANATGTLSRDTWKNAWITAVRTVRNAGIRTTLVVDAPAYGQDNRGQAMLWYARDVQAADPERNCLFSVHMYCEWSVTGNSSVTSLLPAIRNSGIPIIVGEFGFQHSESGGTCDINETQIINTANANGIGWLAWSWKGNGGGVEYLDLSFDWAGNNLTSWGNTVVNGAGGTKTATVASVFNGTFNAPPVVSITAPSANASFAAPATISITANASDADGTISQVRFFNGTTLIGTDNTAPYQISWAGVAAGTYSITAIATDNGGANTTSSAVSISVFTPVPPNLATNKPVTVSSTEAGANVASRAVDGMYSTRWSSVYADPQWLYVDLGASYDLTRVKITWEVALGRDYLIQTSNNTTSWSTIKTITGNTALVNDHTDITGSGRYLRMYGSARGTTFGYSIFELEVYGNPSVPNVGPTVELTAPVANASFMAPAVVNISANASDADGSISRVEFYHGTTLVGSDNTSPYSFTWTGVAAGTYSITARAIDNLGASGVSSPVSVVVDPSTVNVAPVVSITAPANNTAATAPATFTIAASASDADGTIQQVQFFSGSTLLGSDATAPYSFNWSGVAAGTYVLTARATDDAGTSTTSAAVTVTVSAAPTATIIGPDCSAPFSTISFELNANRRTNVTSYTWWFTGSAASVTPVSGSPFRVTIQTGQYYNGGQVCVGTNLNVAPFYVSHCKTITRCSGARAGDESEWMEGAQALSVSPNPSASGFTLVADADIAYFEVISMLGKVVWKGQSVLSQEQVQFGDNMENGVYTLRLVYASGKSDSRVIQKIK
ncbi:MAG: Ig-like domain-containing protein [Cytophagaceae bacterium]|nr:Ig-like domain-containing protein [Cytophagaceae bacterium]